MMLIRRKSLTGILAAFVTVTSAPFAFAHSTDLLEAAPTAPARSAKLEAMSGTVRELVIEDHVAGLTVRQLMLIPAMGKAVALVGSQVGQLKDGQAAAVTGRRNGTSLFVDALHPGKAGAAARPEATDQAEGRFTLAHVDNFDTGKSEYLYEVRGDDGTITGLALAVAPEALQAGMRVRAHGTRASADAQLEPSRIEVLALPTLDAPTSAAAQGVSTKSTTMHSVLVVAVKFTDTPSDPLTNAQLQSLMVTAPDSVANFFKEVSFSQHQLSVAIPIDVAARHDRNPGELQLLRDQRCR